MTAAQFKIGDVVGLRSGGPLMTITDLPRPQGGDHTPRSAICDWHKTDGEHQCEEFPLAALVDPNEEKD